MSHSAPNTDYNELHYGLRWAFQHSDENHGLKYAPNTVHFY